MTASVPLSPVRPAYLRCVTPIRGQWPSRLNKPPLPDSDQEVGIRQWGGRPPLFCAFSMDVESA